MIGDSWTEGEGATARELRYVNRFRDDIRVTNPTPGVPGGNNYITAIPTIASYPPDPPRNYPADFRFGFGRRGIEIGATPIVFNVVATSVRIAWFQDTGTGSFSYTLDGAAAVTVSTNGPHADGQTTTISGLGGTAHSISIVNAGGYALIEGVYVFNGDETKGIRVWEAGHYGWGTADFNETPSGGTATDWLSHLTNVQPDLVTIELGVNDAQQVPAATFKAGLQTLIANVNAAITVDPGIILIACPAPDAVLSNPWAEYVAAMEQIAAAPLIDVLDLGQWMPPINGAPPGWYADAYHPANRGHSEIARALVAFVTP
jgi:hypothetical protein